MRIHNWALVGALAFLAACQPSSRQDGGEGEGVGDIVPAEEPALAADEAWVLADQVGLAASSGGNGGPEVIVGTKVKVLESSGGWSRVQAPEGTGWVPTGTLAPGMRRGALVEAAEGLEPLTFVGYAPVENDADRLTILAAPTKAGDPARAATVAKSLVSYQRDDVQMTVQWRLAALEAEAPAKAERLNKALASYAASRFAPRVQETIESLVGKSDVTAEEYSQIATVQGAAEVYSAPHGSVVGQLSAGEQVQTVERTGEETFSGSQGRWYKLADPAGWVFGTSLTF